MLERISRLGCRRAIKLWISRRTRSYAADSAEVFATSPNSRSDRKSKKKSPEDGCGPRRSPPHPRACPECPRRDPAAPLPCLPSRTSSFCRLRKFQIETTHYKQGNKVNHQSTKCKHRIKRRLSFFVISFEKCCDKFKLQSRCEGLLQIRFRGGFCWLCE